MGFWTGFFFDPIDAMRERKYDDVKYIDIPNPDPILAYRTVLWINNMGYRAFFRNCEDDVYDVLRAFGVEDLTPPSILWLPKSWFKRFRGTLAHVGEYRWRAGAPSAPQSPSIPQDDADLRDLTPWHPTWRRPWHPDFSRLNLGKFFHRPSN